MNKFLKISLIILILIIIAGAYIYAKNYIIGNIDYSSIVIEKVTIKSDGITIKGTITDSGRAYKDFSYTQVDTEIYVSIKNVMVNKNNNTGNFEINIPVNGMNIKNIHLTDNKTTKVIYSN